MPKKIAKSKVDTTNIIKAKDLKNYVTIPEHLEVWDNMDDYFKSCEELIKTTKDIK